MKVKLYLARPTIEVNGKRIPAPTDTVIFARISYAGYQLKYYLDEVINPKYWNNKEHRAKETSKFPQYPEFNNRLKKDIATIETVVRKYYNDNNSMYPTPQVLKPLIDIAIKQGGKINTVTFLSFFDDFIKECENGKIAHAKTGKPLAKSTITNYKTTLLNITRYVTDTHKKVDFDNIDIDFYSSFTEYLETFENKDTGKEKQSLNTIGKHIKVIKTILNEATEQGINKNLAYKSKKFITVSEDADTIYLTDSELKQIAELDLKDDPRLDCIRDLFLVGCSTGLRFSDLSTLNPSQIKGSMITITQIKTGKPVVIPVHDIVKQILNKYDGKLPEPRSNQKTNEYIKEVCQKVNSLKIMVSISVTKGGELQTKNVCKCDLVSTHTARRSFATNEYLAGTPSLTIMAITGHRTEKSFLKYIRVTPDQHAKILQDIWAVRKTQQPKKIAI